MGENGKVKECKQQLGAIAKELLFRTYAKELLVV
jgi:hypothetical protein